MMSDSTVSKLLRENGVECVPHGMRTSLRTWAADTGVPHDVGESLLGHAVGDATVAAYLRTDYLDQRRPVMQKWSDYLGY